MNLLEGYRRHWPRIGGVLGAGLGLAAALTAKRMPKARQTSLLNFAALTAHQFEEYVNPGTFPGHFNGGVLHSDRPDRYPLDTNSAMLINTVIGYPFYALPVAMPERRWLGLGPALFGMAQAGIHSVVFARRAGVRYSPGVATAALLHVPLGIRYIRALQAEAPISRDEWTRGALYALVIAAAGIGGPNVFLSDRESPHRFTPRQLGPYRSRD